MNIKILIQNIGENAGKEAMIDFFKESKIELINPEIILDKNTSKSIGECLAEIKEEDWEIMNSSFFVFEGRQLDITQLVNL